MKRILGAVMVCSLCAGILTGCHSSDENIEIARNTVPVEEASDKEKKEIKVGVIYATDPAEGTGCTYAHDTGIRAMQENLGLSDSQIVRKSNVDQKNPAAVRKAIEECVEEGCNLIFAACCFDEDVIQEAAKKHPEVCFSVAGNARNNGKNLNHYYAEVSQARYLSGIAAGLRTQTDKIGYVASWGKENAEVTSGLNAFAMGVYSVNENARIYVKVTESWLDSEKEAEAARELIQNGCDVIAQHCGTSNPQIEAEKAGVWGVGYSTDMETEAPDAVLTSVLWDWSIYYTYAVKSMIEGTWDNKDYMGSMRNGMIRLSGLSSFNAPDAAAQIENVQSMILAGTFSVFTGKMKTNTGDYIGEEGKTISEEEALSSMDWYFRNIKEQ